MERTINDKFDLETLIMKAKRLSGYKTKKEIINLAVKSLIAELEQRNRKQKRNFFIAAKDLAGCLDGPRDLSFNKEYLTGYGR